MEASASDTPFSGSDAALDLVPGCVYCYVLQPAQAQALFYPSANALIRLHHDYRPLRLSEGVWRLTGFKAEIFTQGDVFSLGRLIVRDEREKMATLLKAAAATGEVFELLYRICGAGSELHWLTERGRIRWEGDQCRIEGWLLDVSNQKQAEESEQVYRLLVAGTRTGFLAMDDVGTVQEVNEPLLQLLGLAQAAQMQQRSIYGWVARESQETMARFLLQVVREGAVRDVEIDFRNSDGRIVTLALHAVATQGEYEVLIRCLMLDVTQIRQEQRELRQSRNLLAESQRIAGLGFWVETAAGHDNYASPELLELLGLRADQAFTGQAMLLGCVREADRRLVQARWAQGDADGQAFSMEFIVELAPGLQRIVRSNIRYELSAGGLRLRTFGVLQDITAFRQAEQALLQSEQRYRSLFATSIDGICMLSLAGVIEEANPAFLEIVGYEAEDLRGCSERAITPVQWHALDAQVLQEQILLQGYCESYRKEYIHSTGRNVPVSVRQWLVRDAAQQPVRIMAMVRDITEYKKIEQEREHLQRAVQQAQKMEAIGHLTGGIAHDFNNILTSILGYSDLALRQLSDQSQPRLLKYLQQIKTAGERARELIAQMLLFSRGGISSGRIQDICETVQATLRMLRPTLPASIRIRSHLEAQVAPVMIDTVQLQQVIMNLVINARDASGERGEIRIDVRDTQISQAHCASCHQPFQGDFVQISVRDGGSGIEPVLLQRIFDPFFTTKPVGQGTGMGLSVVHGIVHEFSGHLQVHSWTGQNTIQQGGTEKTGTEFCVYFPCRTAQEEIALVPAVLPLQPMNRQYRLVVVDDEVAIIRMLQDLLQLQGYEVVSFSDSRQALQWMQDPVREVDLLLTDHIMPGLSGADLAQQMLLIRPLLKVVMISAQADLLQRRRETPFPWVLLNKPLDVEQLLGTLANVLQSVG